MNRAALFAFFLRIAGFLLTCYGAFHGGLHLAVVGLGIMLLTVAYNE